MMKTTSSNEPAIHGMPQAIKKEFEADLYLFLKWCNEVDAKQV